MRNNVKYKQGIIYKYTSPSGKVYIGQTIDEDRRKYMHEWNANNGISGYFYNAIRKYGFDSFEYQVLFSTASNNVNRLKYLLNTMESYYIRKYKANNPQFGYNLTEGGEGVKGLKRDGQAILLRNDEITLRFNSISSAAEYLGVANVSGLNTALRREYNVYKGYEVYYEDSSINRVKPKVESPEIKRLKERFNNISFDLSALKTH